VIDGYDTAHLGERCQAFRKILVPSSSKVYMSKKSVLLDVETLEVEGTTILRNFENC
jgi:hypothetical protein